MTNFLIHRPIAVLMSFLALIIFSTLAIYELPVSLLPDTEVPQLTVSVSYPNASPQEIEQNVLQPIRESFGTLNGLKDVESQASYEFGTVSFTFSYSTSMNLAYISANEKMDRLMALLPDELERPKIIKANTSDIPIIKIQAIPKAHTDMVALSNLVVNVVKKRVEQIEGVSLVDINGIKRNVIAIEPDIMQLNALGLTNDDLVNVIRKSNLSLGSISVKDGQYRYYIKIKNLISDLTSIKELAIKTANGKTILLNQVAKAKTVGEKQYGYHIYNQKEALVLNVHKQATARIINLVPLIKAQVGLLNQDYKNVEFTTTQDQSALLDLSINNLTSSLIIGGLCAFLILFAFMGNAKIPLIIGISLPSSLLLAFLLFWAFNLSINIVSLSGLALGLGMLIDNAIIVIDNITRKRTEGLSVMQSCVEGVEEVISPLISSVLTTLAVFVPLIFLGGISGALFYDQAVSIAAILGVSLLVAFILLPVLYYLFFGKNSSTIKEDSKAFTGIKRIYKRQYSWVLGHSRYIVLIAFVFTVIGFVLSQNMVAEGLPALSQNQKELVINWNEPITAAENKVRVSSLLKALNNDIDEAEADIGISQYLLQSYQSEIQIAHILLAVKNDMASTKITDYLEQKYPRASCNITDAPNAFDQIFSNNKPFLEARLRNSNIHQKISPGFAQKVTAQVNTQAKVGKGFQQQSIIKLQLDYDKLSVYNIDQQSLLDRLNQIFGYYKITEIKSFDESTPIYLSPSDKNFSEALKIYRIENKDGIMYPISHFVKAQYDTDFKYVLADQTGTYQDLVFDKNVTTNKVQNELKQVAKKHHYLVSFAGEYFNNKENISKLTLVLLISVLLLYFILVAQFESFKQPLIVIATLPIGIAGSLYALYLTNTSINIMSGIGIVIMLGIIVNDSILKIDTINRLRTEGISLDHALIRAGSMRLKPILMTSITTILALLPILFFPGLGSTLQAPLVYAVTGGLTIGTLASVYLIPVLYKWLIR